MLRPNDHINDITPYIPGKPIDDVKRELGLSSVIKLASNENNYGLPRKVVDGIKEKTHELFLYPDGSLYRLRKKLATRYVVSESQLIFGNGSDELLQLIALAYLGPDREALVSEGTFSEYAFSCKITNAPFRSIPLKNYAYDLDAFSHAITPKTSVIFLCNPNNPTGTWFASDELAAFIKKIPTNILIVIDEAYFEYARGGDYPDSLAYISEYSNVIILRTFSKLWSLAGLRIGYGLADQSLIESLNRVRQPFNVNRVAEEAALLVLDEDDWAADIIDKNNYEREKMMVSLRKMGLNPLESKANFIFFETPLLAKDLFELLLGKGIIVRAMGGFGFIKAIRVTLGLPVENVAFIHALKEVLSE